MDFGEQVHIIPFGFEFDRVVKPFERFKANRVYLLTLLSPESPIEINQKQEHYIKIIVEALKAKDIEVKLETNVDLFNILQVMKRVAELVMLEKAKGNDVYVNMSAAGRLTSLASSLAAMAHNAKVYYVSANGYSNTPKEEKQHGLTMIDKLDLKLIPNFQISLPDAMGRIVLVNLCLKGKHMRTDEIIKLLISKKIELFEDETKIEQHLKRKIQQKNLVNLNKAVLSKLEKSGYKKREKLGRLSYIVITESGRYIAHILGLKD